MTPLVKVVDHPLVQHKLTHMRMKETPSILFRQLLAEIGMLLGYEVTRDLPVEHEDIRTPLAPMRAPVVRGKRVVIVSILRAGEGMLQGVLQVFPSARVGHIGIYRDSRTLVAVEYYFKLPHDVAGCEIVLCDPMLATGHSAVAAIDRIKEARPGRIKLLSLVAAPEGVAHVHEHHPDVAIYTAAVDERLDDHGYIVPGLGDAGDRLYGTK